MNHIIPAFLAIGALAVAPAKAQECVNADPSSVLVGVQGDFEIRVDPQDPEENLIFISNVKDGASQVVAARVDGITGQVMPGSLATVANDFYGQKIINGPEFVQKPSGELGIVYAGPGGVHAVFRSATPKGWNAFNLDVHGDVITNTPPRLPATSEGAYPAPPIPLGQHTHGQLRGDCASICYGSLSEGVTTDVTAVLAPKGLTVSAATQSPTDGYIYISACKGLYSCNLYEAQIDGAGGFVPNSFQVLAGVGRVSPVSMAAARHPLTGATILFSNRGANAVDVWEQPGGGGGLRLIRRVSVPGNTHYRVETDRNSVVLHYLVRSGTSAGSYTIPVAAPGSVLNVGTSKKVTDQSSGAEVFWSPAANKWAVLYRSSEGALRRCWFTP